MDTPVQTFPKRPRATRRDWSSYMDGQIWKLTCADAAEAKRTANRVRQWAWVNHYTLTTQRQGTDLYIQADRRHP